MESEDNKTLVRRFYAEIDAGNIDAMDDLVAEDYLDHNPPFPGLPAGREGLKQAFRIFWTEAGHPRDSGPGRRRGQSGHQADGDRST
ncbi:UNVERIFIED_ORG: ketosteroid isomerase-like protein [Arthrobacter sp. UYEF1]